VDTLEDWLRDAPALVVHEFAGGRYDLRKLPKAQVEKRVLADPEARARAEESRAIEAWAARYRAETPRPVRRADKARLGW